MKIRFDIEPEPKLRARTVAVAGHVKTYTPATTLKTQSKIADIFKNAGLQPFTSGVPLRLELVFYRCKPRWLKAGEIMPVRKPDLDNYLKLVMDALSGLAYPDDSQITTILVKKRFTRKTRHYGKKKKRTSADAGYIIVKIVEDML